MRHTFVNFAMVLSFTTAQVGCQKEGEWFGPIQPPVPPEQPASFANTYLIGCEGNFQYGNASLTAFYPDSGRVDNQVFERANGYGPGDVLQSMLQIDSLVYLVMNNSGLIRVISAKDYREVRVLDGLNSPRYAVALNGNRLAVSSFGGGAVHVIDRRTGALEHSVKTADWTEQLYLLSDRLYAVGKSDSTLIVIDTATLTNTGAFHLGGDPIQAAVWDGAIYVGVLRASGLRIVRFTDDSYTLTMEYATGVNDLSFSDQGITLLTADSLLLFDWDGTYIHGSAHDLQTPYSLYTDDALVIATDVLDYLSKGRIEVYDQNLKRIEAHETGLIPQAILHIQQP